MKAVEFVISIRDKASSSIERMATEFSRTKTAADKLTSSIGQLQTKGENLKIARDASTSISEIKKLNREIDQTEQKMLKLQNAGRGGFKSMAKDAMTSMPGGAFLTNPLVMAGAGLGVITKLGMENEKTVVSFDVLLGSQEKEKKMLKEMNSYAAKTPYEKQDLYEAGKMMLGFGIAQEKIMPNIKMLGDIAMGDAQKLNSLTLAFSQMSSAGKLQGQDLLQMINAGFNPLNEMVKMTGRSMGDLRKDMENGKISAEMVAAAFQHATSKGGLFYGMTDKIGETIGGRLSTAIDNLKEVALNLFNVVAPVLSPALNILNFTLGTIAGAMTGLFGLIQAGNPFIIGLGIAIGAVTLAMGINYMLTKRAVIMTALKNTWDVVSITTMGLLTGAIWAQNAAWMANPIGWIVAGIVLLVGAFVLAYNKLEWFRGAILAGWEAIKGFGNLLKEYVIDRIKGIIAGIGGIGKTIMYLFKGEWSKAWDTAKQAASDLIGVDAAKNAVKNAKEIGKNMGAAYHKGVAEVQAKKAAKNKTGVEEIASNAALDQELAKTKLAAETQKKVEALAQKYHEMDGKKGVIFGYDRRNIAKQMEAVSKGSSASLNDVNYNGVNDNEERQNNKSTASEVAGGGSRSTAVTINLGKMVENIIFQGGLKENKESLTAQVEEIMLRVLYAAQTA